MAAMPYWQICKGHAKLDQRPFVFAVTFTIDKIKLDVFNVS